MYRFELAAAMLLLVVVSACSRSAGPPASSPSDANTTDRPNGEDSAGKGTGMATGVDAPADTNTAHH